jgi:ubiquinone/menaquinone biosynthesis C-methylase UbiE/uncharacterized protein YbaR (Trm112 family)
MIWLWLGLGLVGLAALSYWQLIIAEGAYLGPKVVAWTYDLVARRYDAIKQFVPREENWFVGEPLAQALEDRPQALVLDVATGTGRLPLALLRKHFQGQIIGLDLSRGMLRQASAKLAIYGEQVHWLWQDARRLPFDDDVFDAVICLESLEFMPRPLDVLAEMVRVLAPGGVLFVSNRVGRESRLLPGKVLSRPAFRQALAALPLRGIAVEPWQVQYDLAMARKVGKQGTEVPRQVDLAVLIRCPTCGGSLRRAAAGLSCPACQRTYPIRERIVHLAAPEKRGVVENEVVTTNESRPGVMDGSGGQE